jgi:CRISPR-associated endonuclease Cas1
MARTEVTPEASVASLSPEDIRDATEARAATYVRDTSAAGICVVDGMGLRIHVERGALVVEDGIGEHHRSRRFDKATHGLRRLVVMGSTGFWTLDALHWCRRLGVGVLLLAPDGTAALVSTPRMTDDARLRRVQAQAPDLPVGLDIAHGLLGHKLMAQAALLACRFDATEAAETISALADAMTDAESIDELRQLEASSAAIYWQAWVGRPECSPYFSSKDRRRVPPHWSRYEGRRSVLASVSSNRKAERPVNSILNYVYALVEVEAILACHAVGLDPGLGLVHKDTRGRQSLALDLMEPVRAEVDAFVLDLLERRTFRKVEFVETPEGHCRLRAPLTHELGETLPRWARSVAPFAEKVAHMLGEEMAGKYVASTPLTTRRHRAAQAKVKARRSALSAVASSTVVHQRPTSVSAPTLWNCPECGGQVSNARHVRCEECIAKDPSQAPAIRANRGRAIAARKRALREWDEANPGVAYDPEYFRREVLPRLGRVKIAGIMEAAGISKGYASNVRAGKYIPHVSTWPALARLVGLDAGKHAVLGTHRPKRVSQPRAIVPAGEASR